MRLQPISVREEGATSTAGKPPQRERRKRPERANGSAARRSPAEDGNREKPEKPRGAALAEAAAEIDFGEKGSSPSNEDAGGRAAKGMKGAAETAARPVKRRLLKQSKAAVRLMFLKRLQELHASGMPIGDCFRLLTQRLSDPRLRGIATEVWRELSEGRSLGDALRGLPDYFEESQIAVIEAGEATGQLGPILQRVIEHLEKKDEVRRTLLTSLAYPAFIVTLALVVGAGLVFFLLPKIKNLLDSLGSEPNWTMVLLMGGSDLLITATPVALAAAAASLILIVHMRKDPRGLRRLDRWLLRLPIAGPIIRNNDLYQISSIVGTLTTSGINMTETLRLAEKTVVNTELRARFHAARVQVNEGLSLANALRRHRLFPELALDIITVGENTGNLTQSLNEIADGFRRELSARLNFLVKLVTGVALGIAFAMVALIAISLITSVLQASGSLST
jgi:type II secretory pathway component PulF